MVEPRADDQFPFLVESAVKDSGRAGGYKYGCSSYNSGAMCLEIRYHRHIFQCRVATVP